MSDLAMNYVSFFSLVVFAEILCDCAAIGVLNHNKIAIHLKGKNKEINRDNRRKYLGCFYMRL